MKFLFLFGMFLASTKAGTLTETYEHGNIVSYMETTMPANGTTLCYLTFDNVYTLKTRTLNKTHIEFQITANTTGWVGLGIGKKYNAVSTSASDVVIGGVNDATGKPYVYDMYGRGNSKLKRDKKIISDWVLVSANQSSIWNQTTLTYHRLFKTKDPNSHQDYKIKNDVLFVQWFMGKNDTISKVFMGYGSSQMINLLKDGIGGSFSLKGSTLVLTLSILTLNWLSL